MMEILFRLLVYAANVWISNKYADGYWVVGPVFGMAVISYDLKSLKDRDFFKHALFFAASTLIYALVYQITRLQWGNSSDLFNYFLGSFPAAVVTGSVLMPFVHRVLFNKTNRLMVHVIASLILSFYFLTLLMYWSEKSQLGLQIKWLTIMIAVWQGIYLYLFFGLSPEQLSKGKKITAD